MSVIQDNSITSNNIQPASGQALTIKDEGGTASITVATNGGATFAENIVITAGKGIDFSNASGSYSGSSGALFDDYEEGSVQYPLEVGGSAVTGGYNSNYSRYIKVGNTVTYSFFVDTSNNTTTGGTTGAVKIRLPFVIQPNSGRMTHHITSFVGNGWATSHMWYAEYNDSLLTLASTSNSAISRTASNQRFWLAHTFSYITS